MNVERHLGKGKAKRSIRELKVSPGNEYYFPSGTATYLHCTYTERKYSFYSAECGALGWHWMNRMHISIICRGNLCWIAECLPCKRQKTAKYIYNQLLCSCGCCSVFSPAMENEFSAQQEREREHLETFIKLIKAIKSLEKTIQHQSHLLTRTQPNLQLKRKTSSLSGLNEQELTKKPERVEPHKKGRKVNLQH